MSIGTFQMAGAMENGFVTPEADESRGSTSSLFSVISRTHGYGDYALRLVPPITPGGYGEMQSSVIHDGTAGFRGYVGFVVEFASILSGDHDFAGVGADDYPAWDFFLRAKSGKVQLYDANGNFRTESGVVLVAGQLHLIEINYIRSNSGTIQIWVDGNLVISDSGVDLDDTGAAGSRYLFVKGGTSVANQSTLYLYYWLATYAPGSSENMGWFGPLWFTSSNASPNFTYGDPVDSGNIDDTGSPWNDGTFARYSGNDQEEGVEELAGPTVADHAAGPIGATFMWRCNVSTTSQRFRAKYGKGNGSDGTILGTEISSPTITHIFHLHPAGHASVPTPGDKFQLGFRHRAVGSFPLPSGDGTCYGMGAYLWVKSLAGLNALERRTARGVGRGIGRGLA